MTATAEPAEPRGARPRALIVTLYGAYGRGLGGWVSVADLIRLLADLEVDEPAVRSSISRLKRRAVLVAERRGGAAGYSLSTSAQQMLAEGDRRIRSRPTATLAEGWLLAVFSIPESERQKRHTLRSRLTWLGFGTVAAGVWIAPAQLRDEAQYTLDRLGLSRYVDLFHADYLAFADLRDHIGRWWDLAGLRELHDSFIHTYQPTLERWSGPPTSRASRSPAAPGSRDGKLDDAAAFADYVRALTDWRRMPYLDPGLPGELLPADWRGAQAAALYARLEDRLGGRGLAHVQAITGLPLRAVS